MTGWHENEHRYREDGYVHMLGAIPDEPTNVRVMPQEPNLALRSAWTDVERQLGLIGASCTVIYNTKDPEKFELSAVVLDDRIRELQGRVDHLRNTWLKERHS